MDAHENVIEIDGLGNRFGSLIVHENLNFEVKCNNIVALVGNSGCGKTTLMRSILFLQHPSAGRIKLFGQEVRETDIKLMQEMRLRWGVMFQQSALFSSLTLQQNIEFPLREFTKLPGRAIEKIALIKLSLVGLPLNAADKFPAELSGGMRKRAALARALAMDPELLFLDEPTSGLDPNSADAFDELILQLRDMLGLTIVFITHDMDTLWQISDSIAFLGDNKILAQDSMKRLLLNEHPEIKLYFSGKRSEKYRR